VSLPLYWSGDGKPLRPTQGLKNRSIFPEGALGKYNEEAIVFAGKLDDKLASTRLSEDIQMAKRKLEAILKFGSHTK